MFFSMRHKSWNDPVWAMIEGHNFKWSGQWPIRGSIGFWGERSRAGRRRPSPLTSIGQGTFHTLLTLCICCFGRIITRWSDACRGIGSSVILYANYSHTVKTKPPFWGMLYLFRVWNQNGGWYVFWLFFKIRLCLSISFKRPQRELSIVAEHSENKGVARLPIIFQDSPMFSHIIRKVSARAFHWCD